MTTARGTILLVDDEESIRIIGSALLRAFGISLNCVEKELASLEQQRIDLGSTG